MNNTLWEKQIIDYFGWKSICKGDREDQTHCRHPFIHTHEFSDVDNEFRREMISKGLLKHKCNCGHNINENDFKFCVEAYGTSLGSSDRIFDSLFMCDKCKCRAGYTKIVNYDDIVKNHIVDVNNMVE